MSDTFRTLAGIIFIIVALAHFVRLTLGWEVLVNAVAIPTWVSGVVIVVNVIMGIWGLKGKSKSDKKIKPDTQTPDVEAKM